MVLYLLNLDYHAFIAATGTGSIGSHYYTLLVSGPYLVEYRPQILAAESEGTSPTGNKPAFKLIAYMRGLNWRVPSDQLSLPHASHEMTTIWCPLCLISCSDFYPQAWLRSYW
jgi:hypothetical protein